MKNRFFNRLIVSSLLIGSFSQCVQDEKVLLPNVTVPTQLVVNKPKFVPEDVFVYKNTVYVSGAFDGTIQKFDLTQSSPTAQEIVTANSTTFSRWGLAVDESKQTLLNVANVPYSFDGVVPAPATVFAYKLSDNTLVSSWTLPPGTVGDGIIVANGFYYISDIGPNSRIIRLNPNTGEITIKTDPLWPSLGFGFSNIIYANNGLYGALNGKMWFAPLDSKGDFGTISQVTGLTNVAADGMTWAGNNTFYYAENDATNPANVGKVWKVSLTSNTTATESLAPEVTANGSLNNPSGVFYTQLNNKNYLFVDESQAFNPTYILPFKVNVFQIP